MTHLMYGERLKYLREQNKMSQEELAERLQFESRQIVSNIENGIRKLSGEELVSCTEIFDVKLDFFTNPYILAGQGCFSWRQSGVPLKDLYAFEATAGEWIGAYRVLRDKLGRKPRVLMSELRLTKQSSYEDAISTGEAVAMDLKLGDIPAKNLIAAAEEYLDAIVLMADPQDGISGAACRLPEMNAIIINRNELLSRRSFDLAHEIFHILTWEAMPPDYLDGESAPKSRVEQLADKFASGLLLPSSVVEKYLPDIDVENDDFVRRINEAATTLMVSAVALLWRLVDLKKLTSAKCKELTETDCFKYNGGLLIDSRPARFSPKYLELIASAVSAGLVSERRISKLLDLSFLELEKVYDENNLKSPFGL